MFGYACKRIGCVPNLRASIPTPLGLLMQQCRLENKLSSPHGSCHLHANNYWYSAQRGKTQQMCAIDGNMHDGTGYESKFLHAAPIRQYQSGVFGLFSDFVWGCGKYLVTGKDWGCLSYITLSMGLLLEIPN